VLVPDALELKGNYLNEIGCWFVAMILALGIVVIAPAGVVLDG
jgi:hypothetical protein